MTSEIVFITPEHQGDNEVCAECKKLTPNKYHECTRACTHLVSWAINNFNLTIVKAMTRRDGTMFP